jgi:acetylornithine deacetylase
MPDESIEDWQARLQGEAERLQGELRAVHPDAAVELVSKIAIPPLVPEERGAAEALARRLTGDNAASVVSYQTEAGQFQAAGLSTVVCGPGSIAQAHQPDEFITVAQLDAGERFMRALIRDLAA